ncbi:MAG: hypothetical protein EXR92_03905 [Gemmatimonadetes bacterium]|nr:hypothetical protein [Gemmatimonadota bacterium]
MTLGAELIPLTDLHSHLIPGVDDGARTLEDSLEGIGRMFAEGITTIVTTPHLDGSLSRDPRSFEERLSQVDKGFRVVADAVRERFPKVTFRRGNEVMLDIPDPDLSDPRVHLAGNRFVLVEWPRLQIPPETPAAIRGLASQGIHIVIAHPERYAGHDAHLSIVERWRGEGAWCQVNYGSLLGKYGPDARSRAFMLLERGWVDCFSSDFHGRPGLPLFVDGARERFKELGAEEAWSLLTGTNPGRIVRGEPPIPVSPFEGKQRGLFARLLSRLRT